MKQPANRYPQVEAYPPPLPDGKVLDTTRPVTYALVWWHRESLELVVYAVKRISRLRR